MSIASEMTCTESIVRQAIRLPFLSGFQTDDDIRHKIPHLLGIFQAFRTIYPAPEFVMRFNLMPVPIRIGAPDTEFFSSVFGNGTAKTAQDIKYPAWWTVQNTPIGLLSGYNGIPFSD
jgi:hypothetical protein